MELKLVKTSGKYQVTEVTKNCYRLVSVIKEYTNRQEAVEDLTRLLKGEVTESELKS